MHFLEGNDLMTLHGWTARVQSDYTRPRVARDKFSIIEQMLTIFIMSIDRANAKAYVRRKSTYNISLRRTGSQMVGE